MEQDYFNTLPSGYIEYVDKLMKNLVVGSHKGPEWMSDWDIRLDDKNGNTIFSIYGEVNSDHPIYRISYSPSAFLFNMVPMGGEGNQLEFMTQLYEKYNIEEFINDFFERRNQDIDIIGHQRGFNEHVPFN